MRVLEVVVVTGGGGIFALPMKISATWIEACPLFMHHSAMRKTPDEATGLKLWRISIQTDFCPMLGLKYPVVPMKASAKKPSTLQF